MLRAADNTKKHPGRKCSSCLPVLCYRAACVPEIVINLIVGCDSFFINILLPPLNLRLIKAFVRFGRDGRESRKRKGERYKAETEGSWPVELSA